MQSNHITKEQHFSDEVVLYDRHGPAIFDYLRWHTKSLEDAEDLLLDVFLAALQQDNLASFSPGEQLAWLRRVAQHKLANVHRSLYRHPQVPLDSLAETLIDKQDGPEPRALQQEELRFLREQIQRLPKQQQHILQLRYTNGLRCTEIAILLNKSEAAVRQLLSRTIRILRHKYLQKEGDQQC